VTRIPVKRLLAAVIVLALTARSGTLEAQEFSAANADALLRTLSIDIGPRPMGSPGEQRALGFAVETLLSYGCDTAWIMPMTRTRSVNTSSGVAVGIKKGRTGRMILLGGHIDSAGPEIPGANDDGSGSAVVLEAARVLGTREMESTIVFALFGGEEQGLQGSRYFVEHFDGMDSVALMIQTDMANGLGTIALDPDAHGASAPPWLVRAAVEEFNKLGYTGLEYPFHYFSWNYAMEEGSGSDHNPFLRAGIPAIDFTTDVTAPIHTPQDTYNNFEPAGLKRSGDLVLALVRRFDGGVPSSGTENYLLCLLAGLPLFIPLWGVWLFLAGSAAFALLVLLRLRGTGTSEPPAADGIVTKRRWSSLKLLLISLVVVVPAWYSSNLIGLLKNERYPWFTHPGHYYILAMLASVFGILVGLRMAGGLKLSRSPYILFKRSFIALVLLIAITAIGSVKIAVAPALCLFLLALSVGMRLRVPAAILALISPFWIFRLIFSEADALLFRFIAPTFPGTFMAGMVINGIWVAVLTLIVFSWLPGFVAMVRVHGGSGRVLAAIRSRRFLVITAGLFGIYTTYLVLLPSYERPWYPDLHIERVADLTEGTDTVRIRGSEYLSGAEIRFDGTDTIIGDNSLTFHSPAGARTGDPWLSVARDIQTTRTDSATVYHVTIDITTTRRPYTLNVTYRSSAGNPPPVSTSLRSRIRGSATAISWYSFPDTPLRVPVSFTVQDGDTIRETIEATFDTLAPRVEVQYRSANVFRRMTWRESHGYGSR